MTVCMKSSRKSSKKSSTKSGKKILWDKVVERAVDRHIFLVGKSVELVVSKNGRFLRHLCV